MGMEQNQALLIDYGRTFLGEIGLSEEIIGVLGLSVRVGAWELLTHHDLSPEELQVKYKGGDGKAPSTIADTQSAESIMSVIKSHYPSHEINEEESGKHEGDEFAWYVDPLDGTSSYIRGQRYSTVGAALYHGDALYAAAICHPFEKELLIAQRGMGTFGFRLSNSLIMGTPGRRVAVSTKKLKGSTAYIDGTFNARTYGPKLAFLKELAERADSLKLRMTGSNIDQQRQVATGRADLTLTDAVGGFHDITIGALIIQEAGGRFTDVDGKQVGQTSVMAVGTNGVFHDEVLEMLSRCYRGYTGFR